MKKLIAVICFILVYSFFVRLYAFSVQEIESWTIENQKITLLRRLDEFNDCKWDYEYLSGDIVSYRTKEDIIDGEAVIVDDPCPFNSDTELQAELDSWKAIELQIENQRLEVIAKKKEFKSRYKALGGMGDIRELQKIAGVPVESNPDAAISFDNRKGFYKLTYEEISVVEAKLEALEAKVAEKAVKDTEKQGKKNKVKKAKDDVKKADCSKLKDKLLQDICTVIKGE